MHHVKHNLLKMNKIYVNVIKYYRNVNGTSVAPVYLVTAKLVFKHLINLIYLLTVKVR